MSQKVMKASQAISEVEGDRSMSVVAKLQALRAILRHVEGLIRKLELHA